MNKNQTRSSYYTKANLTMLLLLCANFPVMVAVAYFSDSSLMMATIGSLVILTVPTLLYFLDSRSRLTSLALGAATMFFSALMIHLGKGRIEMHFHIFVFLAITVLLADPFVVLLSAALIAVHHIGFFFFLPASVFNYEASFATVLFHAAFVIAETIPLFVISLRFQKMVDVQGRILENLDQVTTDLRSVSESSSKSSQELTAAVNSQGQSVDQTMSALTEITAMVESNLGAAKASTALATTSLQVTQSGQKAVAQMVSQLADLKQESQTSTKGLQTNNERLKEIVHIINQVADKTKLINDIVFQTKLLSFNASVEAARAGEHGKGFAVVAEEIGVLARTSGLAASEIGQSVGASISKVQEIVTESASKIQRIMEVTTGKVEAATQTSQQCSVIFAEIQNNVQTLNERMREITAASGEQSKGIADIHHSIQELSLISKQQENLAQSSLSDIETLKERSDEVAKLSGQLKKAS